MPGSVLPGSSNPTARITPQQQQHVGPEPAESQPVNAGLVPGDVGRLFAWVEPEMVPNIIDRQQRAVDEQPFLPEHGGPQERHAQQIAQEQRRIAQRQQHPPQLQTMKMKKITVCWTCLRSRLVSSSGRIRSMAAPVVPMKLAKQAPAGEERAVRQWMGRQIALDADAAADRVKAEQQDDEWHVLAQDRIGQHVCRSAPR